jgi:uncharacterized membrane protein YfcA
MTDQAVLLAIAGAGIASIAMFSGLGGGVFWMPLLLTSCNLPAREAVITTLLIQCFGQASAFAANAGRGLIDWRLAGIEAAAGVPGAAIGVWLFTIIEPSYIQLILGIIIFLIAYIFLAGSDFFDSGGERAEIGPAIKGLPIAFAGGILTGLLGIGTGDWLVPYFNKKCKLAMNRSVATGIALMMLLSITAFSMQTITGTDVRWDVAFPAMGGVIIGAQAGSWMLNRTSDVKFKEIFVLLLVFLAAHITFNALP